MSFGGSSFGGSSFGGGGLPPVPAGVVDENNAAVDTLALVALEARAFAEAAATVDAVEGGATRALSESAATVDTLSGLRHLVRSLAEGAVTADTAADKPTRFVDETALTDDVIGIHHFEAISESNAAVDVFTYLITRHASFTAQTVVVPVLNAFQSFVPPDPQPGLTGLHEYEVIVTDKYGVAYGQIESAVPTEIQWVLNDIGEAQIDCWILDPTLIGLLPISSFPGAREIQIWRDNELIWWGWPTSATYDSKQVHITCAGLLYPFSRRNFGPVLVNYLLNPQFELPSSGPGVVPEWSASGVAAFVINQSSAPNWPILLGNQALLLVQSTSDEDTYVQQDVAVSGGTQGLFFDLSAWVYLVPGVTYGDAMDQRGLFVQLVVDGVATDVEFQQITVDTGQGNWVRLETGIDVPPGVDGTLNIRLYAPQGYTIWDACTLSVEESRGSAPTGSDVQEIIDIIVTYAQQASAGKSDLAIPFNGGRTNVDLIRIYQFSENAGILDALNEFPTIGVCDFEVTWDGAGHIRYFQIYAPAKGVVKYNYPLEIDLGQFTDLEGSIDGTGTTTASTFLGQGSSGSSEDIGYAAFPCMLGGRVVSDAFIALNSNVITGSFDFTDDDIGQGVYFLQGGVLPIASTISSIISSTQCEFVNPSGLGAQQAVTGQIAGVGGIILEDVQSALNDLPIGTLLGSAQGYLNRQLKSAFLPTARMRADGPDGLFGLVEVGDTIPVMFNYGWLNYGPELMRIATITLYPPTEELQIELNTQPLGAGSTYGG